MTEYILNERVLTDDTLSIPDKGKIFKGGYIAVVQCYTYANAWNDKPLKPLRFRSKERLFNYLERYYPEFDNTCIE